MGAQSLSSPDDGSAPAFSPVIFRTRYLQLARHERLNEEQFARLSYALTEDPELFHSWRLLFSTPSLLLVPSRRPLLMRPSGGRRGSPASTPVDLLVVSAGGIMRWPSEVGFIPRNREEPKTSPKLDGNPWR